MTLISDRKTGDHALQCDACPDTFGADEPGFGPQELARRAREGGWQVVREAAEWRHYCPTCARFRNRSLL